jgi:hypothetical protein
MGHALAVTYAATYRDLVRSTAHLKPGTLKTRITGIMGAFKLCPLLAAEDIDGKARKFWGDHHRSKLADARAAASSNIATPAQVDNMVTLPEILRAARSLTHSSVKQSQDKVLLTLAALVPAKRADWARLRIVKSIAEVDDAEDALVVRPAWMTLGLNRYKTSKTYGRHVEDIDGEAFETVRDSLARSLELTCLYRAIARVE